MSDAGETSSMAHPHLLIPSPLEGEVRVGGCAERIKNQVHGTFAREWVVPRW